MNFNTKSALYSVVFAASVFGFTAAQAQSDTSSKVPNAASAAENSSKESNAMSATSHSSGSASLKVKQEPWFSLVYGFEGNHGGSLDKPRAMTAKMWFPNHVTAAVSYTNYDVLPAGGTGRLRLSAHELGYDKPLFTNGKFAASVGASAGLAQIAGNGSVNEATGLIGSVDADLHYRLSGMGLLATVSYSQMNRSAGVNFSNEGTFNVGVGLTYKAHSA